MQVLYPRCCALDVHKQSVVACLRLVVGGKVVKEVRTFSTTTASLMALSEWLAQNKCTHIAMEATGVYWKPVWHILSDGDCELLLAMEDANIKLDSVITDIMGLSGRKMIEALIAGRTDPAKLARLADPRVKASHETLREALRGRVTRHHRFLLRLHLQQIDAFDAAIASVDREVEVGIAPFRTAVEQVTSVPGVKDLSAR